MTYDPRDDWYIELIFLLFTSFFLPNKVKNPSDFYNWLYFGVLLIPASVLSAQQGNDRFHLFLMFAALWISMAFRRAFTPIVFRRTIINEMNYRALPYYSVFLFVIVILLALAISVGFAFNLNFEKVYDVRFDISENMPLALRYLVPLASGTLIGYLGALVTHRREVKGMLLIVVSGILFFGFSSHKAMLFNPLVAMAVYFLFKISRPHLVVLGGLSTLAITALLVPEDGVKLLGSLIFNRVVFIPSHINFFYFEFFTSNSFMLWAESKISLGLVATKLPMAVMKYIGGLMTGNYDIAANTGWVANAYMNAGVIGIVIYAAIIGFILASIDFWAKVYGKQLVGAVFLVPVVTMMMTADVLIVLLTAGLFVLLMIFQITTMRISIRKHIFFRKEQNEILLNPTS
jgi:hypothetical protein